MQIYENQTINNNINHLFNTLHSSANWPDYGQNIVHRLYIYSAPNNTLSTCCFIRVTLSDINIFTDMLLAKGGSNIRIFKDETSFYVYIYKSTWSRTNIEVFSDNHSKFYFTDVTDQISISDLEEISIS